MCVRIVSDDDYGSVSSGGRLSICSGTSHYSTNDEQPVSYSRTGSALTAREDGMKPGLWPSLFNNVPPVIYFSTAGERGTSTGQQVQCCHKVIDHKRIRHIHEAQ